MGNGLKDQWGVTDPAKAGSDKQAQEFQTAFKSAIACANGHLQYTSANAEPARHSPLEARRDALYPAFQSALAQIDRANPAKAKGAIDSVLADTKALSGEVAKFRAETEKAKNGWQPRQPKYDAAVHQVEELEAWGDAKAAPLRALVDGIRTEVNEHRYAPASTTVDQLVPKLKPIFDEYQKQKVEKPKYEQGLAEKSARLDALKALEKPSQPMTAKTGEADTALGQAKAKADGKDYLGACEGLKTVKTAVDALDKLAKDPLRAKFLADRKAAEDMVNSAEDASFKSTDADWKPLLALRTQSDAAADSGDYGGANKTLTDLKTKLDAFKTKIEELKTQRKAYEDALAAVQSQLVEFSKAPPYLALKPTADEINKVKGEMEAATQKEDYVAALASGNDLKTKLEAFQPDLKKIQQAEDDYKNARAALKPKLDDVLVSARELASLKAGRDAIVAADSSVESAASAQDFEKALELVKDLATKVDAYLKDVKVKEDEIKRKAAEVIKKIDSADDDDRDNIAREFAGKLTPDELKALPSEVRNRLLTEMQDGNFSDDDKAGCKKLYSEKYLDPVFEKFDDAKRKEMIEKMKNDPEFKKARDNWGTLNPAERAAVMKRAVDYQAGVYGIPKTTVEPYDEKDPLMNGYYKHSEGKLYLSKQMMQNKGFDKAMETAVHENGHRYQNTLVDKLNAGEIKPGDPLYNQAMTFKLNDKFYVQPPGDDPSADTGDEYFTQPMETQSRRTGDDVRTAGIGK